MAAAGAKGFSSQKCVLYITMQEFAERSNYKGHSKNGEDVDEDDEDERNNLQQQASLWSQGREEVGRLPVWLSSVPDQFHRQ